MKTAIIYLLLTMSLFIEITAQYNTDFGVQIGASNYLGEIGGNEMTRRDFILDMKLEETNLCYGVFFRHRVNDAYGFQFSFTQANISGDDQNSANPERFSRNLHFKNRISEISVRGEYYFYTLYDVGNRGRYLVDFRPYIFAGIGAFYHNPKTSLDNVWYNLRPLQTEGEDNSYSLMSVSIPSGVGCYFTFKNRYRFSMEMAYRFTLTDYLDDVSTHYAVPSDLPSELAVELANRNDELEVETEVHENNYEPGGIRGNQDDKDGFLTAQLGMSYVLRGNYKVRLNTRGGYQPKLAREVRIVF